MRNHDVRASSPPMNVPLLDVHVTADRGHQVVRVSGELDMGTRHVVENACRAGDDVAVVVELGELTFMDCCGYAGLVAARRRLQEHGGSLTLRHQVGQPARLLALLGAAEPMRPSTGSPGVAMNPRFGTPSGASTSALKVGSNGVKATAPA